MSRAPVQLEVLMRWWIFAFLWSVSAMAEEDMIATMTKDLQRVRESSPCQVLLHYDKEKNLDQFRFTFTDLQQVRTFTQIPLSQIGKQWLIYRNPDGWIAFKGLDDKALNNPLHQDRQTIQYFRAQNLLTAILVSSTGGEQPRQRYFECYPVIDQSPSEYP